MVQEIVPVMVGMGLMAPYDGLEEIRKCEHREQKWKGWEKEELFLGADSEHPDGVYARNGNDMVCMTNEEFIHWYGRRSHSSGNEAG